MDLSTWTTRPTPGLEPLEGRLVRLEPLDWANHGPGLFAAIGGDANADMWGWMPVGPWPTPESLRDFFGQMHTAERWRTMVIRDRPTGRILGSSTYMRIREAHGSAEIGCVAFGPDLQRTPHATEAQWLMATHVFALGYRRYEWKCNKDNAPSNRAAQRFGFSFEGVFRNDMVTKGRSRDTCWYSITDEEWPRLNKGLQAWLAPANFVTDGSQIRKLELFR